MPLKKKYDLIVVGAGPGGSACAKTAADLGLEVLLIERADSPGLKNMSGSVLFNNISTEIFPNFMSAPFHEGQPTLGNLSVKWAQDNDEHEYQVGLGPGSDTMELQSCIDRSQADAWMADQAVQAGAEPLYGTRVDNLLWDFSQGYKNRRVCGVITETGKEIYADAVADCSGLHSEIARVAGLIPDHAMEKVQYAVKLVMAWPEEMDEEVKHRFGYWVSRDGRDVCDWMKCAVYFGSKPDYFAAHVQPVYAERIVDVCVYEALRETWDNDFNIWRRMDWYLDVMRDYLAGMKPIHVNFHSLNAFDMVGYDGLGIQLPGLFLVGDAASYCNPVDSWGANVSQWMGRLAAQTLAQMKKDGDYSAARFAEYQKKCENDWVGMDALHTADLSKFLRDGRFQALWDGVDEFAVAAVSGKFTCQPYGTLLPKAIGKMLPHLAKFADAGIMKSMYAGATSTIGKYAPFMDVLRKIKE